MQFTFLLCRSLAAAVASLPMLLAEPEADWPTYNRDLAATRFSPLAQINSSNVAQLALAWSYRFRPDSNSPPAAAVNQITPIIVNGVMYLPAGNRVVALEADTGKEIWRYELPSGVPSKNGRCRKAMCRANGIRRRSRFRSSRPPWLG